jgi:hypothetical protein
MNSEHHGAEDSFAVAPKQHVSDAKEREKRWTVDLQNAINIRDFTVQNTY